MEILNFIALCCGFIGTLVLTFWGMPPICYNKNGTISMKPLDAPKDPDGTNYTYIRQKYYQFYFGFRVGLGLIAVGFVLQGIVALHQLQGG